jgi:hypothetical protein
MSFDDTAAATGAGALEMELRERVAKNFGVTMVTRREAIRQVGLLFGGTALVGQAAWLSGCVTTGSSALSVEQLFNATEIALLDEIADTILPETDTPGARAAGVGPFMAVMVADTYTRDEQLRFVNGLGTINSESVIDYDVNFRLATPVQRLRLLERIDREQYDYMRARVPDQPVHYFRMIKELTLLGYFTSEIGCTEAQRYVEAPGRFEPCVPYTPGDRSWAAHA